MGAEPWMLFVAYQPDLGDVLKDARAKTFREGAFRGSEHRPASIEAAVAQMLEDGTCSILDIDRVTELPEPGGLAPADLEEIEEIFGTTRPTRQQLSNSIEVYGLIDRGEAVAIPVFETDKPMEYCIIGYSYD